MKTLSILALLTAGLAAQATAPILETFDAETSGTGACSTTLVGTLPAGWSNGASAPGGWQARATATTSANTGPTTAFGGTGNYVYTETSGTCGTAATPYILNLPSVDISGLSDPAVRFQAHLWGDAIGTLAVEALDPTTMTWVNVGTLTGAAGNAWRQYEFSLIPVLTGASIDLRFVYNNNTAPLVGFTFTGDAALDDVEVADRIGVPGFFGDWQVNSPEATVTLNGTTVAGSVATAPATTEACATDVVNALVDSTLVGFPYDIALDLGAGTAVSASAGGFTALSGVVNVDITSTGLSFLNGFTFSTPFPGTLNLPVPGAFFGASSAMQAVWANPSAAGGLSLSQAAQFDRVAPINVAFPFAGPTGDDTGVLMDFGCASVNAFGSSFTSIGVESNGRLTFGALDNDLSPSLTEALSDVPFFGYWTDLNPSVGGTITATSSAPGIIDVDYVGVGYFGETGTACTYRLTVDTNSGTLTIDGLTGLVANPVTGGTSGTGDNFFLGLSAGNLGATDAGPSSFAPTSAGTGALASDMLYEFGQAMNGGPGLPAGVIAGTNTIQFLPTGGLSYTFITF